MRLWEIKNNQNFETKFLEESCLNLIEKSDVILMMGMLLGY